MLYCLCTESCSRRTSRNSSGIVFPMLRLTGARTWWGGTRPYLRRRAKYAEIAAAMAPSSRHRSAVTSSKEPYTGMFRLPVVLSLLSPDQGNAGRFTRLVTSRYPLLAAIGLRYVAELAIFSAAYQFGLGDLVTEDNVGCAFRPHNGDLGRGEGEHHVGSKVP